MSRVFTNARTTARSPGASFDCVAIVDTSSVAASRDLRSLYTTKRCLLVTGNRYNEFSGYGLASDTEAHEQRKRVHIMYDFVALDLVRQRREQVDRAAEHARLVREARPRKRRGHETQGR